MEPVINPVNPVNPVKKKEIPILLNYVSYSAIYHHHQKQSAAAEYSANAQRDPH